MSKTISFRAYMIIFIACLTASMLFGILYRYDNKYNTNAQIFQDGTVVLPDVEKEKRHAIRRSHLAGKWMGDLPRPYNISRGSCGRMETHIHRAVFQLCGISRGRFALRCRYVSPEDTRKRELYHAYPGGVLRVRRICERRTNGLFRSVSPYRPYIKDLVFSFEINGDAEILIQTANYSHYYSGVTYPPAIGSSEAVSRLITVRMLFYGLLVFTSLALALFAAVIWFGTRKGRASGETSGWGYWIVFFAAVMLSVYSHAGYLRRESGIRTGKYDGVFGLVLHRAHRFVDLSEKGSLPERVLSGITGGFVLISLVFSLLMTKYLPGFVPVYGQILYWYKALIAVAMTVLLICRFAKRKSGQISFCLQACWCMPCPLFFTRCVSAIMSRLIRAGLRNGAHIF